VPAFEEVCGEILTRIGRFQPACKRSTSDGVRDLKVFHAISEVRSLQPSRDRASRRAADGCGMSLRLSSGEETCCKLLLGRPTPHVGTSRAPIPGAQLACNLAQPFMAPLDMHIH
jgi:hypothetical protein